MPRGITPVIHALLVVGATAALWWAAFHVNSWLFTPAAFSARANWIFLPAGLRLVAVLLMGARGAAGLMLGAYLTLPVTTPDIGYYELSLIISSGVAPLFAVVWYRQIAGINANLTGLNGWHIIGLACVCAATNAIWLNALHATTAKQPATFEAVAAVFVGDIVGAALVLTLISFGFSLATQIVRKTYSD